MLKINASIIALTCLCFSKTLIAQDDLVLWYDEPATDWQQEALPLGNGSLGCMVFGGVEQEHIQFNHDTLWIGSEKNTGAYQTFGDIFITFDHTDHTTYRRELNLNQALQTIRYRSEGIEFQRQYFSSADAQVMVFRFTADTPKSYTGSITLRDAHGGKVTATENRITAKGDTSNHQYLKDPDLTDSYHSWDNGIVLDYESQVLIINDGGSLEAFGHSITFRDCNGLTILVAADTNFLNQRDQGWTGGHPGEEITATINKASKKPFDVLLEEHLNDYQPRFERVSIDLGSTPKKTRELTTDKRLELYRGSAPGPAGKMIYEASATGRDGKPDPDLEELMFQFARYLILSCSRPGTMPSNLQGIWNDSNTPPWRCDFHSDVNTQMNYWFVDQANVSECFSPLAEWFYSIREVRREATIKHFKTRGIAMQIENGPFGGSTAGWSSGDASWLANNLWDHYRYTLDEEYLKTLAYPIMKDLFMFWEDHLKEIPAPDGNGTVLVAPNGHSPEHGPREDGVSFDQQLAWDLLSNFARASEILGVDEKERKKAIAMRDQLMGPKIGKWGQLQEWMIDRDDPNNKHRHLSHLIAVHPGRQISPLTTPEFAEAAKVSMNARGDGATGWSKAWKINIWARLHDGDRAYKLLSEMLGGNIYDNLLDAHPPFQIDGNFGYASGVCEMLVQSHMDQIHLLPALPEAWADGQVEGLKARGAFVIDMQWKGGKLTNATIHSQKGSLCKIRSAMPVKVMHDGSEVSVEQSDSVITFPTEAGKDYQLTPR